MAVVPRLRNFTPGVLTHSDRWNSVWQSELIVLLLFDPLYVCVWNWNENSLETTPISLHIDCYFSSSNPLDLKAYCAQDIRFVIRVKRWNMFLPLSFKIKKDRPPKELIETQGGERQFGTWSLTNMSSNSASSAIPCGTLDKAFHFSGS